MTNADVLEELLDLWEVQFYSLVVVEYWYLDTR